MSQGLRVLGAKGALISLSETRWIVVSGSGLVMAAGSSRAPRRPAVKCEAEEDWGR